jgi:hypothetical protein
MPETREARMMLSNSVPTARTFMARLFTLSFREPIYF